MPLKAKDILQKAIDSVDPDFKFDKERLLVALRERIREEYDAINKYLSMVPHVEEQWIVDIIKDIANEEKVHVGELEAILYKLSPEEKSKVKEGMEENG